MKPKLTQEQLDERIRQAKGAAAVESVLSDGPKHQTCELSDGTVLKIDKRSGKAQKRPG